MVIRVSVTEFRNNLSEYLRKVRYEGVELEVWDRRKEESVALVFGRRKDRSDVLTLLKESFGILSLDDERRKKMKLIGIKKLRLLRESE